DRRSYVSGYNRGYQGSAVANPGQQEYGLYNRPENNGYGANGNRYGNNGGYGNNGNRSGNNGYNNGYNNGSGRNGQNSVNIGPNNMVTWQSQGLRTVHIFVSQDTKPETLFADAPSGNQAAP